MSTQNFFINNLVFRIRFRKKETRKIYSHHTKGDTIFIIIMHTVTPINIYFLSYIYVGEKKNKRNLNIEKNEEK